MVARRRGREHRDFPTSRRKERERHSLRDEEAPRKKKRSKKKKKGMRFADDAKTTSGVDVRAVQRRIDSMASAFWKVPEGECEVRILPPQASMDGDFVFAQTIHFGLEDKEGQSRSVGCLRSLDKDCPICDLVEELKGGGSKDDEKVGDDLRAQQQLLCEVLVRPSKRVRIWRMPVSIYRKLADALASPRIGDVTDPKRGRDLLISRKGTTKFNTRYNMQVLDRGRIGTKRWKRNRVDFERIAAPIVSAKKLRRMLRRQFG